MIRLLLADDHKIFRSGLRALLEMDEDLTVVGEAMNGHEVINQLRTTSIDILLLDIEMPHMDGIETMRNITVEFPDVKVIVLSMHKKSSFIRQMLKAGVASYLLKNASKDEVVTAIRKVMNNELYHSPDVMLQVMNSFTGNSDNPTISKRELQIVRLIASQLTTSEIAQKLNLSPHTIEAHRKNILLKLGLRNSAGLVKYAVEKGLLD